MGWESLDCAKTHSHLEEAGFSDPVLWRRLITEQTSRWRCTPEDVGHRTDQYIPFS